MATKPTEKVSEAEPFVRVLIPFAPDSEDGIQVDQTEHVTINGNTTLIPRGQYVNVKVPVFLQLKTRYPFL